MLATALLSVMFAAASPTPAVLAPVPLFRRFGAGDGLPSSTVYKLAQDRDGFLWIGTQDGLARYDGMAFRIWRHEPGAASSLPKNEVSAVFVDRENRVWVGGEGAGANRLDTSRRTFHHFPYVPGDASSLSAPDVWAFAQDAAGAIWIGTYSGGLNRLRADERHFDHFQHKADDPGTIASDVVLSLLGDTRGGLWIGTSAGLDRRDAAGTISHIALPVDATSRGDVQVLSLLADGDGVIASTSAGLFRVDGAGQAARIDAGATARTVYAVTRDPRGDLWLATRHGVTRREPDGRETAWGARPLMPGGLPGELLFDALTDHQGGLWLAALDGGIAYLPPAWRRFTQIREIPGDAASLSPGRVQGIGRGRDGRVWSVTLNGAVDRIDLARGQVERWGPRIGGTELRRRAVLEDRDGRLWLGQHRGVRVFDPATGTAMDLPAAASGTAAGVPAGPVDLLAETDDAVWLSARGVGVARVDRATLSVQRYTPGDTGSPRDTDVEQLHAGADGSLWVAHAQGLDRWDPAQRRFAAVDGMAVDRIHAFAVDEGGRVWVHRFGRIERYERNSKQYAATWALDTGDGWPALEVGAMARDRQGALWLTSPRGLYRVDPASRRFRHFDVASGLLSPEFVDRSLLLRDDGVLVAATLAGVVARDTQVADPVLRASPLHLAGVTVRRGDQVQSLDPTQAVHLRWNDRDLRVEARSLAYAAPARYQFQLEGAEPEWTLPDARGVRELAHLDPGEFRLGVRAIDEEGGITQLAAPLVIKVDAAPWERPWAYALYALLLSGLAFAAARSWRRRVAHEQDLMLASQRRALAEQASASKSEFLAHMGHEIRTPMTGLLGMTELLERTVLDERQRAYAEGIRASGEHMLRLVNDALDLARIEAGRLALEQVRFDPLRMLDDVAAIGRALAARKGIGFVVDRSGEIPGPVLGDPGRVRQILLNIVNNAIKFTDAGEVTLSLCRENDAGLCFRVRDTGPGISDELRERLFGRYEQDAVGRRAGGSGLGLAISRDLAELMGGRITVSSTLGHGSVFSIHLPLPAAPEGLSGDEPATQQCDSALSLPARALDILLVEDDATIARVVTELLETLGHRVRHAGNGLAALAEMQVRRPDVALIDLDLPGLDGLQVSRLIRARETGERPTRLIALTARSDAMAEQQALAAGMDGFQRKPVTLQSLADALVSPSPALLDE
ncbi:hybrid sensor histidine kinase/response regulator [Tahibacter amnicola]|uniref:histidine kinase n=1 Tax=Tahibacter amnicola TaxID=2976241 RepID=A0ABY6BHK2_9GAMM|nr:two-component regulator propeller domain-containing protein [Tahibacter amnicola]UXI69330.1 ATP-binding protein [Tahibacter amnicola]